MTKDAEAATAGLEVTPPAPDELAAGIRVGGAVGCPGAAEDDENGDGCETDRTWRHAPTPSERDPRS